MEITKENVGYYLSVVSHKIQNLLRQVSDLNQKDYVSSSPIILIDILFRILSRFMDELREINSKIPSHPEEDLLRKIRIIHFYITNIIPEFIEAVDTADFDSSTASIIHAFEEIVNSVRFGSKVIIHPTWEYNASYVEIMRHLKEMTKSMGEATNKAIFAGAPPNFSIITFPKIEDEIVLRQALIAHEVGHFVDEALKWSSKEIYEYPIKDNISLIKLKEGLEKLGLQNREEVFLNTKEVIQNSIASWIKEITADFIACCILGPAYLFAFDEISFSRFPLGGNKLVATHPPRILRLDLMALTVQNLFISQVDKKVNNFGKIEKKKYKLIKENIERFHFQGEILFSSMEPNYYNLTNEVINLIYSTLSTIMANVRDILENNFLDKLPSKSWLLQPQDIVDAIKLCDLLEHGLIPTELYRQPNSMSTFGSIMNSGWFTFLCNQEKYFLYESRDNQFSISENARTQYMVLQELVAKALESLQFKQVFLRRKGQNV